MPRTHPEGGVAVELKDAKVDVGPAQGARERLRRQIQMLASTRIFKNHGQSAGPCATSQYAEDAPGGRGRRRAQRRQS